MTADLGIRTILPAKELYERISQYHTKQKFTTILNITSGAVPDKNIIAQRVLQWQLESPDHQSWYTSFLTKQEEVGVAKITTPPIGNPRDFQVVIATVQEKNIYLYNEGIIQQGDPKLDHTTPTIRIKPVLLAKKMSIDTAVVNGEEKYLLKEQKRKLRQTARRHPARELSYTLLEQSVDRLRERAYMLLE